nr:hypothetical protein [Tanacetum cinerariifolium]
MSTQQDIYAAGSENRPPMLNKDNYIPWSSRIIRYARSRPNGKMIVDSIENEPYELTENDIKRMDADDQVIQTILLGLPEDVYAAVDSCETAKEIWERVRQMMKGLDIGEQEKKAKLFNEWEKFTSTDGESIESYYHRFIMLEEMVGISLDSMLDKWHGINKGTMHGRMGLPIRMELVILLLQGLRVLEMGIKPGIQLQVEEFDFMAAAGDLDEIEEVNANCILMASLHNTSTSSTQLDKAPVYDTDGSAEVQLNDNFYDNKIFNMLTPEEQYTDLLEPIPEPQLVPQNDNHVTSVAPNMVQSGGTVETSSAPNEKTCAHQETVYRNLVDQVAQTMHMLNPKLDSFYHTDQKMALGYPNPSYLKKAQLKKQSLYNGNLLLEEHDPLAVYDSEETLELAQEITVSKTISIPNEDLSDDTTPSVARKFLNEVKNSLVTLQRVVKRKMTLEVHNWSSSAHKEVHKIISHEIAPIINQVDARVQNFEIQFLQEAAKFVRDFKSLAKETDESPDKQKSLELKIERLLKASVSHDIMSIVQNGFVDVPFDLQTKLDRTKEKLELCIIKRKKNTLFFGIIGTQNVKNANMTRFRMIKLIMTCNKRSNGCNISWEISRRHVTFKENVSSDTVNASSTGLVHTAITRRPQPKGNTRNTRVPSASKSNEVKKNLTVEDHRRILLLSKNQKTMSSECNNIKLAIRNDKSEIVYGTCKQCLVTANHDACFLSPVNALNSFANNLCANASLSAIKKRHRTHVWKPKQVGFKERLTCKPRLPRFSLKWSPSGHSFDLKGKLVASKETNFPNDDKTCTSNPQEPIRKWFPNSTVFLGRTKDETAEVIKNFLKRIYVRLQALVIIVCTDNRTEFKNHALKEYFDSVVITHETSAAKTPQQNGVIERRNRTLVEAARTMFIFSHALLFLWAENYREDISKLGAKGDIGFFIGYSANSVAYRMYNRRIKKIIETMNVTFDELSAIAFEQNSSRPGLQSLTSGQISSELELTYASLTITPQRPSERDLDILYEPLHNEYLGGRPSKTPRTIPAAPVVQNLQASTASMSIQDSAPSPTNSSNTQISSHNVDEKSQPHAKQQRTHTLLPIASAADDVPNAVFERDLFVNSFATPSTESVSTQYVD